MKKPGNKHQCKYVYPEFEGYNFYLFRIGGPGLGNLLPSWCRAQIESYIGTKLIHNSFNSFKLGPYLRGESQKRNYTFLREKKSITGIKKLFLLVFRNKSIKKTDLKDFKYSEILPYKKQIKNSLVDLLNKQDQFSYKKIKPEISIHIRLGDFKNYTEGMKSNFRMDINWFKGVIKKLNQTYPNSKIHVFSDGFQNELEDILNFKFVENSTSSNALLDILIMSNSKIFVGSISTFSYWVTTLIDYKSQVYFNKEFKEKTKVSNFKNVFSWEE